MKNVSARVCAYVCLATLTFASPASAELIYGVAAVSNATALVAWDSASPSDLVSSMFVTGLQPNETILGIDFRLATAPGQLYALGSSSRLYTVNVATGAASQVPAPGGPYIPALNGFTYGFSFIPNNDTIRSVAETNANFRLNPTTGARTIDADLFYAAGDPNANVDPNAVHAAHTPGFLTPGAAQLYVIDSGLNTLATGGLAPGELNTVGALGFDVDGAGGFDVSGLTGTAYAALLPATSSVSQFYSINLATGAATSLGVIDGGLVITAMAVGPAIPEPATLGLLCVGIVGCLVARRRIG